MALDVSARDSYKDFVERIKDREIKNKFIDIINKKVELINILNELISDVEGKKEVQGVESSSKKTSVKRVFEAANAVLLLVGVEGYMNKVMPLISELIEEKKMVYVSYNKLPKYTKKILKNRSIDTNEITFISCVGTTSDADMSVNPEDLTGLSITIKELSKNLNNPVFVVDAISSFSVYHNINVINKFVSSINDSARTENYNVLWISIDDPEEELLNSKLSQLCDETLRM